MISMNAGLGWSGVAGASTTAAGTQATQPSSTSAPSGTWQGPAGAWATLTSGCTLCQKPGFYQATFFVAALLLVISWRAHLHSVLE